MMLGMKLAPALLALALLAGCSSTHVQAVTSSATAEVSSDDSDFILLVDDDVASGVTTAQLVQYGKAVCSELADGKTEKKVRKEIAGAPWIVPGAEADFVTQAHDFFCPEV